MRSPLMSKDNTTVKKIILYLLNSLGDKIEGKKKVMKLMFLLEYFDISSGKITPKKLLGNDFSIYYYGVFSYSVMNTMSEMIEEGKIKDGFPLSSGDKSSVVLDEDLRKKVDYIIKKFGGYSGYELEIKTLEMLGIKPHEKRRYFGQEIEDILKTN